MKCSSVLVFHILSDWLHRIWRRRVSRLTFQNLKLHSQQNWYCSFFYRPPTKLQKGNVFSPLCLSIILSVCLIPSEQVWTCLGMIAWGTPPISGLSPAPYPHGRPGQGPAPKQNCSNLFISEWSDAIIEFSQKANSVTKIFVITVEGSNLPPLV